jgi:hypothetical protein
MRRLARPVQKKPLFLPDFEAVPVDVPLGGWDAISPLSKMDPKYAAVLQNWVPRTGWMELRQGYQAWCQGLSSAAVESLMTYRPAGAPEQLFAVTNGYVWDVSNQGLPVQQPIGPFSNSRWQYLNFTPPLGSNYLLMVNGADGYWAYTGGVWSQPSVSGVNPTVFSSINMHKERVWFVQRNSTIAWFLPTGGIQGTATSMDFGPLWSKGGYLVATGTWTIDGGLGPDDYFCAVSSRGQMAMYKGTDPTNSSAWALVGVFDFPSPLGNRPFCRVGSDLWMISLEGVIPVSQGLPFDPGAIRSVAITSRIQNAMLLAAAQYQNNFGWEMISFPAQALAILNVPIAANVQQQQYVTNMMTGAWCQFTGWNFNTFALFNDLLYAGDNSGNVVQAYAGVADLVSPINAFKACAFNYFGDPARLKQITMVQPLMVSSGAVTPTIGIGVDFNPTSSLTPAVVNITPVGAEYGAAYYDKSYYAAGNSSTAQWLSAQGEGHALSIEMAVNVLPAGPGGQSVFDTGVFDTAVFDGFQGQSMTLQVNAFNVMLQKGLVV